MAKAWFKIHVNKDGHLISTIHVVSTRKGIEWRKLLPTDDLFCMENFIIKTLFTILLFCLWFGTYHLLGEIAEKGAHTKPQIAFLLILGLIFIVTMTFILSKLFGVDLLEYYSGVNYE